jgi:ABC-2 type transport system ATP-binding protein
MMNDAVSGTSEMNNLPIIEASHVTKTYGTVTAVDDLCLSVPKGTCFGLLGPNGAGKTTLVEIMEGILSPSAGEIRYRGEPWHPRVREHIGIMFQQTALLSYLTVTETLAVFRSLYRNPAGLKEIIDLCELADIGDRYNDKISGGQRQRLLLALALVNQPDLLFLDEPSTGLDPQARRHLWDIIAAVKGRGKTIILTTHYMEEAQQMCDEVAVMDQGKIIARGTPDALVARYAEGVDIGLDLSDIRKAAGRVPYAMTTEGGRGVFHVENVNRAVKTFVELGIDLTRMTVQVPNLETVFLKLTGRRLRE